MSYLSTVLGDTPRHYWRLADGASAIFHDIGSAPVHLVNSQSPLWGGYTGIEVGGGSCYAGAGLAQFTAGLTTNLPVSFECWMFLMESTGLQASLLVQNGNGGGAQFDLLSNAGNDVQWLVGATATPVGAALAVQTWHHLVGTQDAAVQNLYVDGVLYGTVAHAGAANSALGLFIGRNGNNASFFHGFIAECAIYGVALTAARVAAHYAARGSLAVPSGGLTGGVFSTGTGSAPLPGDTAADILASVRKTY